MQIGGYLGRMDKNVKAVYRFEPKLSTDQTPGEPGILSTKSVGFNLVAWVEPKSAALNALGSTHETVIGNSH